METARLLHLIFLCFWGGLVLAEGIVEIDAKERQSQLYAARLHYWMDLLIELPVMLGVLVTGIILTVYNLPLSFLLWAKVITGLAVILAQFYCIVMVIARYHRRGNNQYLYVSSNRVILIGMFGIPFALVSAYLGFR